MPITLESVRKQSYSDLEIVLIDDGSNDNSGQICDDFCRIDPRFKVVHQANKGVGEARNTGLRVANGEFISFVDGGDYLHSRAIEMLLSAMDGSDVKLSLMGVNITESLQEDIDSPLEHGTEETITQEDLIHNMISVSGSSLLQWAVVWNKLFRRELLDGLLFKDYICNEDQDFLLRVFLRIEYAIYVHKGLYYYVRTPDSTIHNPKTKPQRLLVHTLSRYRMLDYLSGGDKKQYEGLMLDYLYRDILVRKDILKNSIEVDFNNLANEIVKNTIVRYLASRSITIKKKAKFMVYYFFPFLRRIKNS